VTEIGNHRDDQHELALAIHQTRISKGLSLREFANRVGVSPATLSAIENGKTGISVRRLQEISLALDESAASFLTRRVSGIETPENNEGFISRSENDWRNFAPLPIDPILAGAVKAFVLTGYHGATMRSIAQFAKMSVPGVYHHYPTKQALLVRILDITMFDLTWRLRQARGQAKEPAEAVALVVEALTLFHAKRRDLAFIGASEMRSLESDDYQRIAQQRHEVQQLLNSEILAAINSEGLNVPNTQEVGRAVTSMCISVAQWYRPDGPTSPEEIASRYGQFAIRLLLA